MGDQPTKVRILLHVEHYPEQFKVHPDLGSVLGIKEDSRAGVIQTLWNYIKINGLQDKADRKRIHIDAALRPVRLLSNLFCRPYLPRDLPFTGWWN